MTPLTVLTSGVGLGSYVAALLHQAQLRSAGHEVDTEVIEGWFTAEHLERHLAHRSAYQRNFRLALAGRQMAGSIEGRLDDERVDALLAAWQEQRRAHFLVWSGYWLPVLERYIARVPATCVELELGRIDAVESDSFRVHAEPARAVCRELWLWNSSGARWGRASRCLPARRCRSSSATGGSSRTAAAGVSGRTPTSFPSCPTPAMRSTCSRPTAPTGAGAGRATAGTWATPGGIRGCATRRET